MPRRPRTLLVLAAALVTATAVAAREAPKQPEPYFSHPDMAQLALSPSGKRIAALAPVQGRMALVVMDVDKREPRVAARADRADINWFAWVNDDRLVATAVDLQVGRGDAFHGAGLHAVDHDGKDLVQLGSRFFATVDDGGDDILVASNRRTREQWDIPREHAERAVHAADVRRAGRRRALGRRPQRCRARRGQRREGDDPSQLVAARRERALAADRRVLAGAGWRPPGRVRRRRHDDVASSKGRDTEALYRFDAARNAPGELLAAHPQVDLGDELVWNPAKRTVVGVRFDGTKPGYAWFDDDWARLAATVDAALPGRFNAISRGHARRVLVNSTSDRDPGSWYLLDVEARKLEFVGAKRKAIRPEAMPAREPLRYRARDGLEIPAYLTLPQGREAKALPLVVLVQGGPFVRGSSWT